MSAKSPSQSVLDACKTFAERVATRIVSDPAKREDYVFIGVAQAFQILLKEPAESGVEFLKVHGARIAGAMKDALRKEARANALDAAMLRGFAPILAQLELGDLFAPTETRTQIRRRAAAALVASAVLSSTQWFDENDPETALLQAEEVHRLRTTVRAALASLDPEDQKLLHELFYENVTLEVAGDRRGITKSGAFKRMEGALERLEKRLLATRR